MRSKIVYPKWCEEIDIKIYGNYVCPNDIKKIYGLRPDELHALKDWIEDIEDVNPKYQYVIDMF